MEKPTKFTKKEIIVSLFCIVFLLMNLGAIGNSGRRRAKEMVCLSNLSKWGSIFEMYTNDNNGFFQAGVGDGHANHWFNALRAYYHNDHRICCCPLASIPLDVDSDGRMDNISCAFSAWGVYNAEDDNGYDTNGDWGSYGINGWVENPPAQYTTVYENFNTANNWRTPNVEGAEFIPLFTDALRYSSFPQETDSPPQVEDMAWQSMEHMRRVCLNRHDGAVNCLFLDFSARKVGLKELWTLNWHRSFNRFNPWTPVGGVMPEDWPQWMRNFKEFEDTTDPTLGLPTVESGRKTGLSG